MRRTFILFVAISSAFGACSSESTNTGSSGAGGSTGGAAATGGSTSGGGSGGSAGAGSGGTAGQGGTGTDAGLGGSDGGGTDGGETDGSVSPLPAKVACGSSAPSCPTNPGRCCFEVSKNSPVCQLEAAPCDALLNTRILCDGSQDCASGQVCCHSRSQISYGDGGSNEPIVSCAPSCGSTTGFTRFQVCDLKQTSPTQCLTGSCKKVVHVNPPPQASEAYVPTLPLGYGVCK
ncbi:MAG: hypothetical protein L6Q84_33100 [Polyangiaceae bacterium]|nr:hypothetical protein [Polyangiaceae bacterium]